MSQHSRFTITFDPQHTATAIQVPRDYAPGDALNALDLPPYNGIIVVHGGAGSMEQDVIETVQDYLLKSLAPLAQQKQLLIVDGATDSGIGHILGEVRGHTNSTYPLLGIMPHRFARYPGAPKQDSEQYPLNPNHSHFIFVDGENFGDESELMVGLLHATSKPGLALIINGGQVVFDEVKRHAAQGNLLVTLRGSGRIADKLADARSDEHSALPDGTHMHIAEMDEPETLTALISGLLSVTRV